MMLPPMVEVQELRVRWNDREHDIYEVGTYYSKIELSEATDWPTATLWSHSQGFSIINLYKARHYTVRAK